jgi:DNA-binding transcriptional regulator YdaS (Cro superfamily)
MKTEFEKALSELRDEFGSYTALAEGLGTTRQNINNMKMRGAFPALIALKIERMTDGRFKAIDIVEK